MKKLALAVLLLSPLPASADSDYFLTWSIATGLTASQFTVLELELDQMQKYFSANGAMIEQDTKYSPATGTCFLLRSSGIITGISCDFDAWGYSYTLSTDTNLTGSLTEYNRSGAIIGSALVRLKTGQ